jgi:secreted trypsin-like serine protease
MLISRGRVRRATIGLVALAALAPLPAAAGENPWVEHAGGAADDTEVFGGQPADPGEDPWMAALVLDERFVDNPFAGLVCGGSLISPDTVITAAHCIIGAPPGAADVIVGTRDLLPSEGQRIQVRRYRIHPDFRWFSGLNDAAVLQLAEPVVGATILPIAGPGDEALWTPGTMARFTGWGEDETRQPVSRLQEAEAPIVDDTDCRNRYGTAFRASTMVCAGDVGPDSDGSVSPCYGDSGGPLTVDDGGGGRLLVGLVAWGFACGDPNYPAVFTEVAAVHDFVEPFLDPDDPPGRVRDLAAHRVGSRRRGAVVTWRPPFFDGGTALTRYVITVQPGNRRLHAGPAATQTRITNLPLGTVGITVAAVNPIGIGQATGVEV